MKCRTGLSILSVMMLVLLASACGNKGPLERAQLAPVPEKKQYFEFLSTANDDYNALHALLQRTITH